MNVVFFCIGAAKAGTSWLHRQLDRHPDCRLRVIKELHYFDALDAGRLETEVRHHVAQHHALLERIAAAGRGPDAQQARWLADRTEWLDVIDRGREDTAAYLDFLARGARDGQIVADMTPSYALLSAERLGRMAGLAGDVRFLFLMRDPVERLWSHVRMIAGRRDPDGKVEADRCGRILARTIEGGEGQISARSDYAGTLERLARAVPGGRVLVEVFEEMISGEGLGRICDFLGIRRVASHLEPVHAGTPVGMTADQRRRAARWLEPQYAAAERALGRMPGDWRCEG